MNMKHLVGMFIIIFGGIGFFFWALSSSSRTNDEVGSSGVPVAASFYPIAFFTEQVGGDLVDVHMVTPSGIEPHDYEPTPSDIIAVENAKLFLFHGAGLDPWAEKIHDRLEQKGIPVVEMSAHIDELIKTEESEEHADEHEDEHEDQHEHGAFDPHFWLDPVLVQKEVAVIADALIALDPEHTNTYEMNRERIIAQLQELHQAYEQGLSNCLHSDIIVSHDAFSYLAKRYTIEVHSISGISPEQEPSARKMQELSQLAREHKLPVIFFESLVSPKLAQTIAREVGVDTLVLNPIEGLTQEEADAQKDYFQLMRENLTNLQISMVCQ